MSIIAQDTSTGRPSEGGHWYTKDGAPCYEIRAKSGLMRAVTLRDARSLGLMPSVSTILQMEHKPMLVKWQVEQALLAALTLPRNAGEDDGAFLARAREDAAAQAKKAAERGTRLHAVLQDHFEGAPCPADDWPYIVPVTEWLRERYGDPPLPWEAERSFAHPMGYGGKCDLLNRSIPVVLDFKCKDFGPEKQAKDLAYPEHCSQLAAYAHGFRLGKCDCLNIFVSTRVPGLIRVREWDNDEIEAGREVFMCFLRAWQIRKGYNPTTVEEAA